MRLLDLLARHPELSDGELRGMYSAECSPNNFAVTKKYLLTTTCDMLADYYKNSDNDIALLREVETLIMLIRKGHYELSLKLWRNLSKRARQQENYPVLLHLRELFQHLTLYYQTDYSVREMQDILEEFRNIESQYEQYQQLKSIYSVVSIMRKQALFRLEQSQIKELQHLLKRMDRFPYMEGEEFFLYNHYYRFTLGTILFLLGNLEMAYTVLKENVHQWQRRYNRIQHDNPNYLEAIYLHNYVAIIHNQYDDVINVLGSLANDFIIGPQNKAFFDFIQYIALNRIYNRTAQYDKVDTLLPIMEKSLEMHDKHLLPEYKRVMLVSMGIAYFATGKLQDAYSKLFIGKRYYADNSRKDQVSFLYLFALLTAYEMGDEVIFRSEYNNTYHFFYNKVKAEEFEREIISALNRAFGNDSGDKKKGIFVELSAKLERSSNNATQQQVFQIFNFPTWIESKILGVSYRELRILKLAPSAMPA